eukprot:565181-Pyramimonas_sp.AAC.1
MAICAAMTSSRRQKGRRCPRRSHAWTMTTPPCIGRALRAICRSQRRGIELSEGRQRRSCAYTDRFCRARL